MKRTVFILVLVFITNFLFVDVFAYSQYDYYQSSVLRSIKFLDKMGVVENPKEKWSETDFIKRRDMFEMLYCVYKGDHNYMKYYVDEKDAGIFKRNGGFADIDDDSSTDAFFAYAMNAFEILSGKYVDGELIADLDSYVTYDEALIGIGRIFENTLIPYSLIKNNTRVFNWESEHPYYDFAVDIGLINATSPVDAASPYIEVSQLNDEITAYEFMHLLYRALYVPRTIETDDLYTNNYHMIEAFLTFKDNDDSTIMNDNTNIESGYEGIKEWEENLNISKETAASIADAVFLQQRGNAFMENTEVIITESEDEKFFIISRFFDPIMQNGDNYTIIIRKSDGKIMRIIAGE